MFCGVIRRMAMAALLLLVCAQLACAEEAPERYSRVVEIEGIGALPYYAQNDPRWAKAAYDGRYSESLRVMKGSGCAPTSIAMAIARQVPAERLPELLEQAADPEKGFPFCACSVIGVHREGDHEIVYPVTADDFFEALPVIFASYATGNNRSGTRFRQSGMYGTSSELFGALAKAYGLEYDAYHDWASAREALEEGRSVITTVTKGIFTRGSHYMCIAGVVDGWIYLLDPLMRSEYPDDRNGVLEVVELGVIRAKEEDLKKLQLYGFFVIGGEADETGL